MVFEKYYNDVAQKFVDELYNQDTKEYNKDLVTFILISIFIIYFIFSLISSFFKLPFIILLGAIMGLYLHNAYKAIKKS
jgi:hypothetical protein